jgi:MFS family permease
MPNTQSRLRIRLRNLGVSRLGLLGALITTGVSANAVVPLICREEMLGILASSQHYQYFLDAVTWIALPFLIGSFLFLNNFSNRRISTIGFALLAILNLSLYLTNLQWHPILLRCLIGIVFGLTIPMGQFSLAAAKLSPKERIKQFTMMLNLVAAGLTIVPFIGIAILSMSAGKVSLLFLFLAFISAILSVLSNLWIPKDAHIQTPSLSSLRVPALEAWTIAGDSLVIVLTRSMYSFVLVWLSATISDYSRLQAISLCFTLPFVAWGFIAIPAVSRLKPMASFAYFLVLPMSLLAASIGAPNHVGLPFALILIALLSIPEAFTPGQLISQWRSPAGRQFGNVLSMALMTICLSIGPGVFAFINQMGQSWPLLADARVTNQAIWFSLLPLPISLLALVGFWRHRLIPPLRRR